jgi:hypothetical protein
MEKLEKLADTLYQLLENHECVIFPETGAFLKRKSSAAVNAFSKEIKPSATTIFFNPSIVTDDGLLVNAWRFSTGSNYSDAFADIVSLKDEIQNHLKSNGHCNFGQLGNFLKNAEGKILFLPSPKLNLSKSTFGLNPFLISEPAAVSGKTETITVSPAVKISEIELKPSQPAEEAVVIDINGAEKNRPKGVIWKVAAAVSLITLSLAAVIYGKALMHNNQQQQSASQFTIEQKEKTVAPVESPKVETTAKTEKTIYLFSEEDINSQMAEMKNGKGTWFVTGGSYMSDYLAANEVSGWKKLGIPALIGKKKGSSLQKVTLGRFNTEAAALDFIAKISVYSSIKASATLADIEFNP